MVVFNAPKRSFIDNVTVSTGAPTNAPGIVIGVVDSQFRRRGIGSAVGANGAKAHVPTKSLAGMVALIPIVSLPFVTSLE